MHRPLFIYIIVSIFLLNSCDRKQNKKPVIITHKGCDSCCLKKLAVFVDTLNIDTSKSWDQYFSDKRISLNGCDLKKFRGNYSLKSSLVLFWLKIDNVYLKHNWSYNYVQDIGSVSNAIEQLVIEFDFLYSKRDYPKGQGPEFLNPSWANLIIEKDPSLLTSHQIRKIYNENKLLKQKSSYKSQ